MIKVGISSCLLGEMVRYNGGHKRSRLCSDKLNKLFDYQPLCPEVGMGMSTPRPPIRIIKTDQGNSELVYRDDPGEDFKPAMLQWSDRMIDEHAQHWRGFILTPKSPSCGMFGVKQYRSNGYSDASGPGVFAERLMQRCPDLPVEDGGRITNPDYLANFMIRVYVYDQYRKLAENPTPKALVQFHSHHKYLLMAYHQNAYRQAGKLIADLKDKDLEEVAYQYYRLFFEASEKPADRGNQYNALVHLYGYVKPQINDDQKALIQESLERFKQGHEPITVPLSLVKMGLVTNSEQQKYALGQSIFAAYQQWQPH